MVALLLLSRDLVDEAAICKLCVAGVRLLALIITLHFTWNAVFCVKCYLKSENHILTLVVFVLSRCLKTRCAVLTCLQKHISTRGLIFADHTPQLV